MKASSIANLLSDLTWHERFEWIHQKKLKGNRLFKKEKYTDASETYFDALYGLDLKNGT